MNLLIILFSLGALIFCSHIFSALFNKIKIPNVLLLMLIGIILGPITGFLNPDFLGNVSNIFTSITLIVILFESGTHLDIKHIPSTILGTTFITFLNFIGILALTIIICHYFIKMEWIYCFFLGSALGGTSIAVIMPIIKQISTNKKTNATLLMEATLGDIISLIVSLAIMEGIKTGEICILDIFIDMWKNFLFSIIIGGIIGFFWFIIIKKVLVRLKNSMFTTFALAFMIYSVCEYLHLNGGLAVISFGIAFSNFSDIAKLFNKNKREHTLDDKEKNFYSEIVFIFQTYFFVYIGINIQLNNFYHILQGTLLVILILLFRQFSVIFLRKKLMGKKGNISLQL